MSEPVPPAEPSRSSSLARCEWCNEFRKPSKLGERCSHCRQKIGTKPLQGLPKAA